MLFKRRRIILSIGLLFGVLSIATSCKENDKTPDNEAFNPLNGGGYVTKVYPADGSSVTAGMSGQEFRIDVSSQVNYAIIYYGTYSFDQSNRKTVYAKENQLLTTIGYAYSRLSNYGATNYWYLTLHGFGSEDLGRYPTSGTLSFTVR